MGGYKVDLLTRAIATIYVLAVATILMGVVWGYCGLFKAKQFENPGVSAYRAPPGTIRVNPLVWHELVPGSDGDVGSGTETVVERTEGRGAKSAVAFSDGRGSRVPYERRHAKAALLARPQPWSRGLVMALAPGRFSHLRNQAFRPSQRVYR